MILKMIYIYNIPIFYVMINKYNDIFIMIYIMVFVYIYI